MHSNIISGDLLSTDFDLMIAQTVPGDYNYNFKGILDDIRIYDYALSLDKIAELFDFSTDIADEKIDLIPSSTKLFQNYPNPFNGDTNIKYQISQVSNVKLEIYNILGQKIKTLVNKSQSSGYYSVVWNGKNELDHFTNAGIYLLRFSDGIYDECRKLIYLK